MFWTESAMIFEVNNQSMIVTTLVGILIQIVKVKNVVVLLLTLHTAAIPSGNESEESDNEPVVKKQF